VVSSEQKKSTDVSALDEWQDKDLFAKKQILMHASGGTAKTLRKMEMAHKM
jgi:hypothetical protein